MISLLLGHVLDRLREMPAESVHCAVTSPPYYGLRDYGLEPVIWAPVSYRPMPGIPEIAFPSYANPERFSDCDHDWDAWSESHDVRESPVKGKTRTTDRYYGDASRRFDGNHQKHSHGQFCRKCGAWRGCLGLEPSPVLYIGHLVQVFRELRWVLRSDGTLWLNLGDSYASGNRRTRDADEKLFARGMPVRPSDSQGIKPKDLLGIPWRVAFALQADGWYLRSDIVWQKRNPMPESVQDRPTRAHEMLFLLARSERYFYDSVAVREGSATDSSAWRNRRDVWSISTKPYKGAHFAVMPPDLAEPCIAAGTSEAGICPYCGKPWRRVIEKAFCTDGEIPDSYCGSSFHKGKSRDARSFLAKVSEKPRVKSLRTSGWEPACDCPSHDPVPCVVLDPFGGSGTVGMVARDLGRDAIIIDANPDYVELARERLENHVGKCSPMVSNAQKKKENFGLQLFINF